jgi:uncharacterized DUF497 family protein
MTTWDEAKRRSNVAKHGVDLAEAELFEFETALVEDDRDAEGEQRFRAVGFIGDRLYFLVYTLREDEEVHAVSLRPATPKERKRYAEEL